MDLDEIFMYLLSIQETSNVIIWRKENNTLNQVPLKRENICVDSYLQINCFDTGIIRFDNIFDIVIKSNKRKLEILVNG